MDELKKYTRLGRIVNDSNTSRTVVALEEAFPAERVLPTRWAYRSEERFKQLYGDHLVVWAHATSSSMLILRSQRVLRVWTDAQTSVLVDVSDPLAEAVKDRLPVAQLPPTLFRKTKPFTKRILVDSNEDIAFLIQSVRSVYGMAR